MTTEGPARDRLIAFRDRIAEAIAASGVPLKLDVAVPVGALAELVADARRAIDRHGGRLIPFGHLAEGNVHLNVLDPGDPEAITADVLASAAGLGGTISAEHGLGIAKTALAPPDSLAGRARRRRRGQAGPRSGGNPEPGRPPTLR